MRHPTSVALAGLCVALAPLAACGGASTGGDDGERTELLVLAASSLTGALDDLAAAFEAEHPDVDVLLSFGGSGALAVQVEQGAPADVVAFADVEPMRRLEEAGLVGSAEVFATNALTIAVPDGDPGGVTSIDDFARGELLLGACAPEAPCGSYARRAFEAAGIEPALDTEEPDVRSLVTKLAAGELDAGIVYVTDVAATPALEAIELPASVDVRAEYPIAVPTGSEHPELARELVDLVRSEEGRRTLADAGFGPP